MSAQPKVVVCGVGALGSHAVLLCRNLAASWVLVDDDRVESKNLSAQAFVKASVGKSKAQALKQQLRSFYGLGVEARPVRLGPHNVEVLLEGAALAVDCFDNAASRRVLQEAAARLQVPLVHGALAADGTFGLVRWSDRFVPDEEGALGQATCEEGEHLPLIALAASTLAQTVQAFLARGERLDFMIGLGGVTRQSSG